MENNSQDREEEEEKEENNSIPFNINGDNNQRNDKFDNLFNEAEKELEDLNLFSDSDIYHIEDLDKKAEYFSKKFKLLQGRYVKNNKILNVLREYHNITQDYEDILEEAYSDKYVSQDNNKIVPKKNSYRTLPTSINDYELSNQTKKLSLLQQKAKSRKSCFVWMKDSLFKCLKCILPFKHDMLYLSYKYNTTYVLLFEAIRFLLILSIFFVIIFLYLLAFHFAAPDAFSTCKYYIPCFFFYSSFQPGELKTFSITYGVYIIFFAFSSILFYFMLYSSYKKQNVYKKLNKNTLLSSYFFNSWNFNTKSKQKSDKEKRSILKNTSWYYKSLREMFLAKKCCCPCCEFTLRLIANIIFIISWVLFAFVIILGYYLKTEFKAKGAQKTNFNYKDILSDIFIYIYNPGMLILFAYIVGFISGMERWSTIKKKNRATMIRRLIAFIWGIGVFLFIQIFFIIEDSNIGLINQISTFGCLGQFSKGNLEQSNPIDIVISPSTYSQCREDEVGINLFFFALVFTIFDIVIDFFDCIYTCAVCSSRNKIIFHPIRALTQIYGELFLFLICIPYFPYAVVFLPFILLIEFKYQWYKVKKKSSINYSDWSASTRSNSDIFLTILSVFNALTLIIISYFYLSKFPHYEKSQCVIGQKGGTVLTTVKGAFCGPIISNSTSLSYEMMEQFLQTPVISNLYRILASSAVLISIIIILTISSIFREYGPSDEYYDYIIKSHKELLSKLQSIFKNIKKRDIISSVPFKLIKKYDAAKE